MLLLFGMILHISSIDVSSAADKFDSNDNGQLLNAEIIDDYMDDAASERIKRRDHYDFGDYYSKNGQTNDFQQRYDNDNDYYEPQKMKYCKCKQGGYGYGHHPNNIHERDDHPRTGLTAFHFYKNGHEHFHPPIAALG